MGSLQLCTNDSNVGKSLDQREHQVKALTQSSSAVALSSHDAKTLSPSSPATAARELSRFRQAVLA